MDSDHDTFSRIRELVAQEHRLREAMQHDSDPAEDRQRLHEVEVELDRCWDLLRQRRALRDIGGDPSAATVRPADEVEGYLS